MGVYDFGAGFLPPVTPNGTLALRTAYYSTRTQKDAAGHANGNDFSLDVLSLGFAYMRMTDQKILGANYGYGVTVPFFRMDADLGVNVGGMRVFSDSAQVFRLADIQFLPVMLQWHPSPRSAVNAQLMIQAPTGDYDKDRLVSPGLNHWAISPMVGMTWISAGGFELSSNFQIDINTRNTDTDYRNGIEYRHEFAAGQHLGDWTVGLGGYYYRQLSDDKSPVLEDGNRARVLAAGPAATFLRPGLPALMFHAYKEFDARNRTEGYNIALRVAYSF